VSTVKCHFIQALAHSRRQLLMRWTQKCTIRITTSSAAVWKMYAKHSRSRRSSASELQTVGPTTENARQAALSAETMR